LLALRAHFKNNVGMDRNAASYRGTFPFNVSRGASMCPACMTTAAILITGTTSAGGLAAFIASKFRKRRRQKFS